MTFALTKMILNMHFFFFKFILFVLVSLNIAFSHGEEQGKRNYHVFHIDSLMPKPNCSAYKTGLRSHKLKLSHRYGPCSPFPNSVEVPSSDEILLKNEARVRWLNSKVSNSYTTMDESSGQSLQSGASLGDGAQYVTTIGLGTPKVDYKVIIDTGSDPTWLRCEPCHEGCDSKSPLFDPSKSSTYIHGSENFQEHYGDNSNTRGLWGFDTLTIEPSDVINNFHFGCGQYNIDHNNNFSNAAGILGLGPGDDSLVSQTASKFGKIFGYCFPKSESTVGYLVFGNEARSRIASSSLKFTELQQRNSLRDSKYFLKLLDISVAGTKLNISGVFRSVGTIIDSGTVVTHLPRLAYSALSSAFNQSMSAYRAAPPQEVLDTCYFVKRRQSMMVPDITFHFDGGTDVVLDQSGIGWAEKDIWCLGFAANKNEDDLTIIGNTQQREMEVLYDIEAGKIGFGKKGCGN